MSNFPIKNEYPTYELTIPSTGQKVRFRPYLSKEEKILLIAKEGSLADVIYAVKQVIANCIIDKIDLDSLAAFDIDYIFIKLYSKSVNNIITVPYIDNEDKQVHKHDIDLDKVVVEVNPNHNKTIKITDETGVIMKYPGTTLSDDFKTAQNKADILFAIIKMCLDKVYDEEEIYNFSDYSSEDINEFLETLPVGTLNKMEQFLETMPQLKYVVNYKNKLGNERKIVLSKLSDFFTLA
jgi:hypothetical protein